jgi:hypothetical protein
MPHAAEVSGKPLDSMERRDPPVAVSRARTTGKNGTASRCSGIGFVHRGRRRRSCVCRRSNVGKYRHRRCERTTATACPTIEEATGHGSPESRVSVCQRSRPWRVQRFLDQCLPKARSRTGSACASSTRDWPEKWTPACAGKAACPNQLPALVVGEKNRCVRISRRCAPTAPLRVGF